MEVAMAVPAILLGGLLQWTLLCDVSLFVTVIAETVAASASEKRTLDWSSTAWSQWHPVFCGCPHWSISHVGVSYLLQCLHLLHPPLHSVHLHVYGKEGTGQELFLAMQVAQLLFDLSRPYQSIP